MTIKLIKEHASQMDKVSEVLMVHTHGSLNYGLYQEGVSDRDYTVFFLPSFEDIVLGSITRTRQVVINDEIEYKLIDIRQLIHMFDKANFASLDFLWSKDKYVNASAQPLFRWLKENGYSYLKQRSERLTLSVLGTFNSLVGSKDYEAVRDKKLVQQFYFLQIACLLLDTKKEKVFFNLVRNADLWTSLLGSQDLMRAKFAPSESTKRKLYEETYDVVVALELRELTPDPDFEDIPETKELKRLILDLVLKTQNS